MLSQVWSERTHHKELRTQRGGGQKAKDPQETWPTQALTETARKRKPEEKTGHTPEAKLTRKETKKEKKFTYAAVTKKVVLVRKNRAF